MTRQWHLHGLVLRSEAIELEGPRASVDAVADVAVVLDASGDIPLLERDEAPQGRVLARHDVDGLPWISVEEAVGVAHAPPPVDVHFHGVATMRISSARDVLTLRLSPGADPGLAPVLVCGTGVSVLLMLRGHPVLHASAVSVADGARRGALVFVGNSGMGKSTVATLMCRDGARLLSDDVVRTDLVGDRGVEVWPGATATRLRQAANALGQQATAATRTTADGRLAAELPLAEDRRHPLLALVVPQPDRGSNRPSVELLSGPQAVIMMARFPRVVGWRDPETGGQALRHWGELARRVPVMIARLPWGPPFAAGAGSDALQAVLRAAEAHDLPR